MENGKIIKNIELLGERYCQKHLYKKWNMQSLETDWWEALQFFFSRSFMRGRRDELSTEYCCFTIETLRNLFDANVVHDKKIEFLIEALASAA